jgi:type II secretory pathway component PulK
VDSLIDWTDADHDGFRETPFYARDDPPSQAGNRLLNTWGELLHVSGFSPELFARRPRRSSRDPHQPSLLDCVTVIPVTRTRPIPVNVNTAERTVLIGVFGPGRSSAADELVNLRGEGPLLSLDALEDRVEDEVLDRARPYLDVKSTFFRLEARAYAEGHAVDLRAFARRGSDGNVEVLQWAF